MQSILTAFGTLLVKGRALRWRHRQFNWVLVDQVVVSGSNFLVGVIVARSLGIEAFGVYSLALMAVVFLQSLQSALVISPMMSVGPKQSAAESGEYFAIVLIHQLVLAFLFAAVAGGGCLIAERAGWLPGAGRLAGPMFGAVLLLQVQEFLRRYNFTVGAAGRVVLSDVVRFGSLIAILVITMYAMADKPGIESVLVMTAASAGLGSLALWSSAPNLKALDFRSLNLKGLSPRFADISLRHLRISRWLVGSSALFWVTSNFVFVAAGAVLGPAAVGGLKAAQTLMAVTHVFFQAAESFVPPKAARVYHAHGKAGLKAFIAKVTLVGALATGLACLALGAPAKFWMELVFGQEYGAYGIAVVAFGLYFFVLSCLIPIRFAFQAAERTRPDFIGYILASIFTLTASYPLLHAFGLYGALICIVSTQVVMMLNLMFEYRRFLRLSA